MKIAIIDADLIGKKNHRFPNLVCMKESGYYKKIGHTVILLTNYENLTTYDLVLISKVFTDTPIDEEILKLPNVKYGGTGFFYDKAEPLPYEIEHHMPDYHLYDAWVNEQIQKGVKAKALEYYTSYSIGYTTRKCFRQCSFCINRNYKKVELHSPLSEFYDPTRKYICMLDDNILGHSKWKDIFHELQLTGRYFQYKQGMDERILTAEKCEVLSKSKYRGDYIFAFDNIDDKQIIEEKLKLWRRYSNKTTKLYVFCGFDRKGKWDKAFWEQDIINTFERIKVLMEYGCLSYIMRFNRYEESPYRGMYITLARWCNQPSMLKTKSFREFCVLTEKHSVSAMKYLKDYERDHKGKELEYFDMKYSKLNKYPK